jgi:hypothetical protein
MVLVAGLMPEELQKDAGAQQLREVQLLLLQQLAEAHPEALFYSNFFRCGAVCRFKSNVIGFPVVVLKLAGKGLHV